MYFKLKIIFLDILLWHEPTIENPLKAAFSKLYQYLNSFKSRLCPKFKFQTQKGSSILLLACDVKTCLEK
jgi:hypothetical protein